MNDLSFGIVILSILITWIIGMIPPILIRYVILSSPMEKFPAIGVAGAFWFINIIIFTALGSENKSHAVILIMAIVSYGILRKKSKTVIIANEKNEFDASIERDNSQKRKSNLNNISEDIQSNSEQFRNLSEESYKQAAIALEYRQDAKLAFNSLIDVPKEFKHKFLSLLDENPKGAVDEYLSMVRNEYDSWLNPYKNDDLNQALHEVRKLGRKAEEEFKEIVSVLGDSVVVEEILAKLIEKHQKSYNNQKSTIEEIQ